MHDLVSKLFLISHHLSLNQSLTVDIFAGLTDALLQIFDLRVKDESFLVPLSF